MGIYVDKRLEELGAERIFELGLGDDDAKYVQMMWKICVNDGFICAFCCHFHKLYDYDKIWTVLQGLYKPV